MLFACVLVTLLAGGLLWRDVKPLLARLLVVHERRYAVPEPVKSEPMPADLEQLATSWGSEQARDDTLTAMRESYAELGDWTQVRMRFEGVGQ
jgi:hypothetical protein